MDRDLLEAWLEQGRSLTEIGALVDRDPTTVSYWLKKHGLKANGRDKYAAKGALAREELEPLVEAGLTLKEISARLRRGDRTIRYWIDAHGLPKPRDRRRGATRDDLRAPGNHRTMLCKQHGPTEFVRRSDGYWRCKRCRVAAVIKRRRKVKRILVEEAGGECVRCGYNQSVAALQFHHLDPSEKAFGLALRGHTRALDELRAEARKCVLLCANCHAEVEHGDASLSRLARPGAASDPG